MSFLSPCVLPIVPVYVAIITGLDAEQLRDGDRPLARIARDNGLFIAGFSAVFVLLGLSTTTVGQALFHNQSLLTRVQVWQTGQRPACRHQRAGMPSPPSNADGNLMHVDPGALDEGLLRARIRTFYDIEV